MLRDNASVNERVRHSVGIAIVNWNAGEQLQQCLASIAAARWDTVDLEAVVIVDNGSTDGSIDRLVGPQGLPLRVVKNVENRGFAVACNQAARLIDADSLLFLNPDTVLESGSVATAVSWLGDPAHASTGIVGIQLVDLQGHVSRSCARFPTFVSMVVAAVGMDQVMPSIFPGYRMSDWNHGESREVDHVIGAFFLVRREVFARLNGFDERFFVYLEDLDFSLRARQAGWRSFYLTDTRAHHRGGGTSDQIKSTRLFYALRSRLQFVRKHFTNSAALTVIFLTLVIEPVVRLAACVIGRSSTGARDTLGAYRLLWVSSRSYL